MFDGPISYNKENINIVPSPLGRPLIRMEILLFKFKRPISNNKENTIFAPSPGDAPGKKYFFNLSD